MLKLRGWGYKKKVICQSIGILSLIKNGYLQPLSITLEFCIFNHLNGSYQHTRIFIRTNVWFIYFVLNCMLFILFRMEDKFYKIKLPAGCCCNKMSETTGLKLGVHKFLF